jgi:hypothetical protein
MLDVTIQLVEQTWCIYLQLVQIWFCLFLCCFSFCLMCFPLYAHFLNFFCPMYFVFFLSLSLSLCLSLSLSLIISFSFLMLNENFLCCLQFFICRDPTFIPKGLERIQKNKHYCGTSVIMQTSCFRFLFIMFLTCNAFYYWHYIFMDLFPYFML